MSDPFCKKGTPLSRYFADRSKGTHPLDLGRADTLPHRPWDWVGNSYMFNATGDPPKFAGGIVALRASAITRPAATVLFCDGDLVFPEWGRSKRLYSNPLRPTLPRCRCW